MASTGSSSWYVYSRTMGREGPISLEAVQALLEKGSLGPQDHAWCPGMTAWKKIFEIDAFSTHLQAPDVSISFASSITEESTEIASLENAQADQANAPIQTFSSPLDELAVGKLESLELETQSFLKNKPAASASVPVQTSTAQSQSKSNKLRIQFQISRSAIRVLCAAVVLGGLTYLAYPFLNDLFAAFPKIPGLSSEQYALLKDAAQADLKLVGPKVELAPLARDEGGSTVYVATNLPDETVFELNVQPITDTLVGEPKAIIPLKLSSKTHLAQAGIESVPPGYYWANVSVPSQPLAAIQRKVFLGGAPDLTYQTHLKDYAAVRRGIAKAELDRIRDVIRRTGALIAIENDAAESLSALKINQAKAQAWELFESTWARNFGEIQGLLAKPMRFSGKIFRNAQTLQELLKKLHEKHHELVPAVVTPASTQLSPGSVTTARALADGQAISNEITAKIKELSQQLDERQKLFENPLAPLTEEP